jgi:hypothetical protein
VVFQVHTIGDVVEVDFIVWMVLVPWHQHLTNREGQVLSRVMRCIHGETEHIQGVRKDMYLAYIFQTNIVGLMYPICNCLQFSVVGCSKTSHRPVVIEVPLMPEAESHN